MISCSRTQLFRLSIILLLGGCGDDGGGDATSGPGGTTESAATEPTAGSMSMSDGTSTGEPTSSGSSGESSEGSGSSGSGSSGAETSTAVPAAPSDLGVEVLGDGLHLTWTDNSDNEDEFVIMRMQDDGAFEELTRLTFDTVTFHDAPLESGSTYTYMVHASNAAGLSEPSNEATMMFP